MFLMFISQTPPLQKLQVGQINHEDRLCWALYALYTLWTPYML